MRKKKAAVIGKDARTDAVAESLQKSGCTIYAMSDFKNPGLISRAAMFRHGKTDDMGQVEEFLREVEPDLLFPGPEEPLAAGVANLAKSLRIPCVGPTKELAKLETSKSFTRTLLSKYDIPGSIDHRVFSSTQGLREYLKELGEFVVKPDGLTGGKGVKVFGEHLRSLDDAFAYACQCLSGGPVVIEERLEGEEFSLQAFCAGETVLNMIPVQDHKRAFVGDEGPNTGGMGSYSCENHLLPFMSHENLVDAQEINVAVANALLRETGEPYVGILYGGFMATAKGVRVIEYNCRFGDPEAMNVLPLLRTDFLEICEAMVSQTLHRIRLEFEPKASVCKYVVPQGYPEKRSDEGAPIRLDTVPNSSDDLKIYYAAVEGSLRRPTLTGSRAVAFVGIGETVPEAGRIAEAAIQEVDGPVRHRADIGSEELLLSRVRHMDALRAERICKTG